MKLRMFGDPVKLPTEMYEKTLRDLPVGQKVWIVPWGMMVDMDGNCFLNGNYTYHECPRGTVKMEVRRENDERYYVRLVGDHRYVPSRGTPWMGSDEGDLIPVAGFIR